MNLEDASSSKFRVHCRQFQDFLLTPQQALQMSFILCPDLLKYMGIKYQLVQTVKTSCPILGSISFRNESGCPNKLIKQVTIDSGAHKI